MIQFKSKMTQSKKRLILITIGGCLITLGICLYFIISVNFSLGNIHYEQPNRNEWETPSLSDEEQSLLNKALNQSYKYIGKGNQSYAFISEDKKFILKFFRFNHLKPSIFLNWLPPLKPVLNYREYKEKSKQKRLERIFRSYKLAYDQDKDSSALVYIHLNKTENQFNTKLNAIDAMGFSYTIDLDKTVFIVQEKGKTTREVFSELLKRQDVHAVKKLIRNMLYLYVSEYKKGIYDRDHNLMSNTGFIGERPFRLDVGKIQKREDIKNPDVYKKDLQKITDKRISKWMHSYFPQYYSEIKQELDHILKEIFENNS